jgi:NAD(P)-dependent dehydrogenase (short-subunit alcohol dehydrogenase family)
MAPPKRLEGRLALVTGASRGIGRAAAAAFARDGAHVIALARTSGALVELDDEIRAMGGTATLLTLDLADGESVDRLGPTLYRRWGKLDILAGVAAALGPLSPLGHVTAADWDAVLAVNLTANWRLIRTLDPLLRKSDAGRAIFVTSGAATGKYAYWGPYAVSKAGLEALARTYAQEVANAAVRVNLVNPGGTRTAMRAKAYPGEDPETLPRPEDVARLIVELAAPECLANGETFDYRAWAGAQSNSTAIPS